MVPKYRVIALKRGTLVVDRSSLVYGVDYGVTVEIPIWMAAIEGNGYRILVDTGIYSREWVENNVAPCTQERDETLKGAIEAIGWSTESVSYVINTHLHYDHCGGNSFFSNAKFFVSEQEWNHAFSPIEAQKIFYDRSWVSQLVNYFSYTFVSNHYEIVPGIRVVMTPGHTPGHLSVLVNTKEGVLAITGDAANLPENLIKLIPPGIFYDMRQALHTLRWLRLNSDIVFTGHDPSMEKFQDSNFRKYE